MPRSPSTERNSWSVSRGVWIVAGVCILLTAVLRILHAFGWIH